MIDPLRNTRRSLVERLGNLDDQASWRAFFDAYGGLLYRVARGAGLSDGEAQDAVQETVITVARNISGWRYDPAAGSFKGWLMQTARWRIADQFRLRERHGCQELTGEVPDAAGCDLENVWDAEWKDSLLAAAMDRVRKQVDPRQFQIFDCYVTRGWPALRAARELGVNVAQVYLAKHRVAALLKKTVSELERGAG